ncbi:hypothetical protein J7438_06975 [Thalassotalea sp. G20_0]|uniref:hypothetical protein n=1 Tax=Thalassotalea sp. G20_0 TaxID=2821093 RepID=UPI001ADA4CF0|nr:hypothetical protein [Thalassotalea sp. G20_0]MBO9493827.1 hypothetical protein [Thalassotalea sp. G20_0]
MVADIKHDYEIERLEISSAEAGVFGRMLNHIRQQHLTLDGALSDDESRLMLRLLNDINRSIYHTGKGAGSQQKKKAIPLCS